MAARLGDEQANVRLHAYGVGRGVDKQELLRICAARDPDTAEDRWVAGLVEPVCCCCLDYLFGLQLLVCMCVCIQMPGGQQAETAAVSVGCAACQLARTALPRSKVQLLFQPLSSLQRTSCTLCRYLALMVLDEAPW
jgi:hypothetical protein